MNLRNGETELSKLVDEVFFDSVKVASLRGTKTPDIKDLVLDGVVHELMEHATHVRVTLTLFGVIEVLVSFADLIAFCFGFICHGERITQRRWATTAYRSRRRVALEVYYCDSDVRIRHNELP